MERQLANLTGLVQKALTQNVPAAGNINQNYLGVPGQYRGKFTNLSHFSSLFRVNIVHQFFFLIIPFNSDIQRTSNMLKKTNIRVILSKTNLSLEKSWLFNCLLVRRRLMAQMQTFSIPNLIDSKYSIKLDQFNIHSKITAHSHSQLMK